MSGAGAGGGDAGMTDNGRTPTEGRPWFAPVCLSVSSLGRQGPEVPHANVVLEIQRRTVLGGGGDGVHEDSAGAIPEQSDV